jgi:hypothetical protein
MSHTAGSALQEDDVAVREQTLKTLEALSGPDEGSLSALSVCALLKRRRPESNR